ncbi:MAG: hypothetical protein M3Z20_17220 [Chloroflexota bacterium]|nr:hypothetical protein [Chloroflexota bacterium]
MMARISSPGLAQGTALLVGFTLAAVLMRQSFAQEATPDDAGPAAAYITDGGCEPTNECRAHHGNIFFGRVIDVGEVGRFEGELDIFYVVYTVDVESLLRHAPSDRPEGREPQGRVQVQVSGLDLPVEDKGRTAPLVVGERYLFFAGSFMNRGYLVDGEVGFLPVASDEEAAKLTEEFAPLIREDEQADQDARARATEAARHEPLTPPAAQIVPARGPAGSEVVVSGSGFSPADVLFLWDEGNPLTLPQVTVDPDGRFDITLTVPEGATPGPHTLTVGGLGSDVVDLMFDVEKEQSQHQRKHGASQDPKK